MTISELVAKLEAIKAQHGDIPVAVVGEGQCDLLSVHAERDVEVEFDGDTVTYPAAVCLDITG